MGNRIIAIGDIHGHAHALAALIGQIDLQPNDTLITLGDHIDRGPNSKEVLDQLLELEIRCHLIPLMGNHEEMMLGAREGLDNFNFWMKFGGDMALDSYGNGRSVNLIPREHWAFLNRLVRYYETDQHFFVHASYWPNRHFHEQSTLTLFWEPLKENESPTPHFSGKIAVVGHTPQKNGKILDLGHLLCIDTGCGHGGLLTALDITSGRLWQVTENGKALLE
jgi:serine/threonine protein phosphatase 1